MTTDEPRSSRTHSRSHSRRGILRIGGTVALGTISTVTPVGAQSSKPSFDGWFAKTENYDGVHDLTGKSRVTITVGPSDVEGGPLAYAPAAVRVSPGTTVVWKWTGKGGSHNVVASDGNFKSTLTSQPGYTFKHTFEKTGVYKYYCTPHKALGMRGIVVVGDVNVRKGEVDATTPASNTGESSPVSPSSRLGRALLFFIGGTFAVASMLGLSLVWDTIRGPPAGMDSWAEASHSRRPTKGSGVSRTGEVIKGWATFLAILFAFAAGFLALWHLGNGSTAFLIGIAFIALVAVVYAFDSVR